MQSSCQLRSMSAWSGIVLAAVALALAFVVIGQPIWEWRLTGPTETEVWSYGVFVARHTIDNKTTGQMTTDETFPYATLPNQRRMSALFLDFGLWLVLALLLAVAGMGLSTATVLRKLRGTYAALSLLGACILMFYVSFNLVLALPQAANDLPAPNGQSITQFQGQFIFPQSGGNVVLSWGPLIGWFLAIGMELLLAWSASDMWHVHPVRRTTSTSASTHLGSEHMPHAPLIDIVPTPPSESTIEEVFVIARGGLLVKHMSRSLMTDKDRDVVGGMISVISNFVREAFSERDGEVQEVTIGKNRFVMYSERGVVLAVLVKQGDTEGILHSLRQVLSSLIHRYGNKLVDWEGEPLEGIEDELEILWEPYAIPPPPPA